MEEQNKPNVAWWQPGLALFVRLSAWIAVPVVIAVFVGKWLDKVFHTSPWLSLLSVGVSFVTSIVMIVRIGLKEMEAGNEKLKNKNGK